MKNTYSKYQKLLNILIIATLLLIGVSYKKLQQFPSPSQILPKLHSDPVQSATSREKFDFDYEGATYTVEPVAEYEISGLIVSHNNISSIGDIYHTSKSVDIKDLCVIWGENLKDGNFKQFKYWSEPWTCFFQTNSNEALKKFQPDQLSNNHLLSSSARVRELIREAKVGDQVSFSGMLVNYYPRGEADLRRKTSTIRADTGQGACEVVFVDNFKIDKEWLPGWSIAYRCSKIMFWMLIILKILGLIILPQIEYRKIKVGELKF